MERKLISCILLIVFYIVFSTVRASEDPTPSTEDIKARTKKILEDYLRDLAKQSNLGFTVVTSREKYYPDGSLEHVDSVAISSNAENQTVPDSFDLSTVSKDNIKKIVNDGEDKRVLVSFYQQKIVNGTKESTFFDTEEMHATTTAASKIPLNFEGFEAGLQTQIGEALDMTNNLAVVQIKKLSKNKTLKKDIVTTIHSKTVIVKDSYKMNARMTQESAETLKKAYKIDVDDRTPLIVELFNKKFPDYDWQVIKNCGEYLMTKDTMIHLVIEGDTYYIIGISN